MSYNTDLQTNNNELQTILNAINALPEVLPEQSKTATPSLSSQIITPDSGKTLSSVQVSAVTKELLANLDSDFIADNIAKDIDLFGLVGTLEGGGVSKIATGSFTLASRTRNFTVNHGLGVVPNFGLITLSLSKYIDSNSILVLGVYVPNLVAGSIYYTTKLVKSGTNFNTYTGIDLTTPLDNLDTSRFGVTITHATADSVRFGYFEDNNHYIQLAEYEYYWMVGVIE